MPPYTVSYYNGRHTVSTLSKYVNRDGVPGTSGRRRAPARETGERGAHPHSH